MRQVLVIHGGNSFSSYEDYRKYLEKKEINYDKLINPRRWKERLAEELPDQEVIYAKMPNEANANFEEWSIYFEKIIPFFKEDIQIVGHSLGAMFLAKYLNDHPLEVPIKRLLLVAGGYDDESTEDLGSFKVSSAGNLPKSSLEIHLFHSKDDPVVPFTELQKFQADLPLANSHIFEDRGHFIGNSFPEIVEILKQK